MHRAQRVLRRPRVSKSLFGNVDRVTVDKPLVWRAQLLLHDANGRVEAELRNLMSAKASANKPQLKSTSCSGALPAIALKFNFYTCSRRYHTSIPEDSRSPSHFVAVACDFQLSTG